MSRMISLVRYESKRVMFLNPDHIVAVYETTGHADSTVSIKTTDGNSYLFEERIDLVIEQIRGDHA